MTDDQNDDAVAFLGTARQFKATPTQRPENAGDRPVCPGCVHWDCKNCGHRHPNQLIAELDAGGRRCVHCDGRDGERIPVYHRSVSLTEYHQRKHEELSAQAKKAQPDPVPGAVAVLLDPADARELLLILGEERYRLDKGDDRPVPQPRWGANVRTDQAVRAALLAAGEL